ncbi:SusC/RagA family TonB-linked outer membrane protein [Flavivirga eckloniae]|nr:SusC/RagA family TonB-linked outer membrane protein [Flavivirga eckloniae]
MKTFILLVCTSVFAMSPGSTFSQEKVTIDADKKVSVDEVFRIIDQQTNYAFIYQKGIFNNLPKVQLRKGVIRINKLLEQTLSKDDYVVIIGANNNIIVKRKFKIQTQKISGKVTDEFGDALIGVSVFVKGTNRGTATDFDGLYEINADENEVLVFSYLGYLDKELTIGQDVIYDVKMKTSSLELDTIEIVSTGYQTLPKERSTGSFERVNEKTLDLKVNQNIFAKIEGEVAGVTTDSDGNFIVRGLSSISANTNPLVVVDGFPIEQDFSSINPNDVASITILKDAAAASIWGIRATNGVIVIVTKKGSRNGKLKINASLNTSITPEADLFDARLGDPATQVAYQTAWFNRSNPTSGFYNVNQLFNPNDFQTGALPVINPVGETLLRQLRGDITASEAQTRLQNLSNTDNRREFLNLIHRPAIWNQYNFSASGGTEIYNFRSSISYNKNQKETIGTDRSQFVINFTNSFNISSKLTGRASVNFSQTKENFANGTINAGLSPLRNIGNIDDDFLSGSSYDPVSFLNNVPITSRILDNNGNYVPMPFGLSAYSAEASQYLLDQGYSYGSTYNIKQELDNANNTSRQTALRLQTGLNYKILEGLDFDASYQYEWSHLRLRDLHNETSFYTRTRVNNLTEVDLSSGSPIVGTKAIPDGGILDLFGRVEKSHTFRSQLNYNKTFSDNKHRVAAIAGYEVRKTILDQNSDRKYGFNEQSLVSSPPNVGQVNPTIQFGSLDRQVPDRSSIYFEENRFISYYANASYTYDNTYTLSASTRLDDTNLFGASDKYKNIPLYSLGLKWNITNNFFVNNETINSLQFRATYGTNGNVDRTTSPFLIINNFIGFPPFNGPSSTITSLPNPELRLEKTRALNLGLDYTLFNNTVKGSIEYYIKDSEDLLAVTSVNPTLGVAGSLINNGTLRNEGIDANLSLKVINTDNFKYTTTGNFSINTNTLKKVDVVSNDLFDYLLGEVAVPGASLRTLYSYNFGGLDRNGAPQFVTNDGRILDARAFIDDSEDLIEEASVIPKYYGSWINNFEYKNLYLRTLTSFKAGHIFRFGNTYIPSARALSNVPADFANRWQNPGDENITNIPAFPEDESNSSLLGYQQYQFSDELVDTAAHIRLSQVSLGYNFKEAILNKLGMSTLSIGLQADNIAVWNFNKWDVDPESSFIPRRATYTFNISASF